MTDKDGNPIYDTVRLKVAVVIDGIPVRNSDGSYETEFKEWIDFGYRTHGKNTRETIDVVVSDYKLATPPIMTALQPGDRVEIRDYTRSFWGEVVKMMTFNLGSNIWINDVKN